MIKRLLLVLLASAASASAQTTAFGTKATANATAPGDSAATAPATKGASKAVEEEVDDSVIITLFRSLTPPEAKTTRTFQLSKVNKLGFTETTKELQRLYSAFATQRIIDGSPSGSSKATGYLATVNYSLLQDLGDNRFLAKAAWPAAGPNEALAAGAIPGCFKPQVGRPTDAACAWQACSPASAPPACRNVAGNGPA